MTLALAETKNFNDDFAYPQMPTSTMTGFLHDEIEEKYTDQRKPSLEIPSLYAFDALAKEYREVEAQTLLDKRTGLEGQSSPKGRLLLLALYFVLNLALTLSNKAVLREARFPWLLTTLHTSSTSIGCFLAMGLDSLKITPLGIRENLTLMSFSILFTLNIAISNISLAMVSVPLHQIMRSACPIVTIGIYHAFYGRIYSKATYLSMIPLIVGIALATAGDYYCTAIGFTLTFLGVILASIKTVITNRLLTGTLGLSATEILLRMSPLANFQCIIHATLNGEVTQLHTAYAESRFSPSFVLALLANAVIAFTLNIVSLQTNKAAGALTMAVCGNVKQALTIGLGIVLFNVRVGLLNAFGTIVTILGAVWYSKVELDGRHLKVVREG